MNFTLIITLLELLYFIFITLYLISKDKIKSFYKYTLISLLFITLMIFNYTIIDTYNIRYEYKAKKLNIKVIKQNIKDIEINLVDLKKEYNSLFKKYNKQSTVNLKEELLNINNDKDKYKKEITEKKEILTELEDKYKEINKEYERMYKKTTYVISPFPTYNQFPNYPNGCESVALHLLLKYNGVNIDVENIVEKLNKGDRPFKKNGKLYGGDPEIEFVGDPRNKNGYGVYEKPIIDVANQFKTGIKNITGTNLDEVLKIVSNGHPVQVWASINMKDTYVCSTWTATSTERTINWLCGLHSLVIIGHNYNEVITSDPYNGKIVYYDKKQFEKMYNTYGKRAIYYE